MDGSDARFVALLDVDGLWKPGKPKRQLDVIEGNGAVNCVVGSNRSTEAWLRDL
jgi:hypothetical protein